MLSACTKMRLKKSESCDDVGQSGHNLYSQRSSNNSDKLSEYRDQEEGSYDGHSTAIATDVNGATDDDDQDEGNALHRDGLFGIMLIFVYYLLSYEIIHYLQQMIFLVLPVNHEYPSQYLDDCKIKFIALSILVSLGGLSFPGIQTAKACAYQNKYFTCASFPSKWVAHVSFRDCFPNQSHLNKSAMRRSVLIGEVFPLNLILICHLYKHHGQKSSGAENIALKLVKKEVVRESLLGRIKWSFRVLPR